MTGPETEITWTIKTTCTRVIEMSPGSWITAITSIVGIVISTATTATITDMRTGAMVACGGVAAVTPSEVEKSPDMHPNHGPYYGFFTLFSFVLVVGYRIQAGLYSMLKRRRRTGHLWSFEKKNF